MADQRNEHAYDIILTAQVRVHGIFMGETAADAIAAAKDEMFVIGQVENVTVERQVLMEDTEMPPPWGTQGPQDTDIPPDLLPAT
jgi:hypothetical protein